MNQAACMSYKVHFSFSWGLAKALTVPLGTKTRAVEHVKDVERILGLTRVPPGEGDLDAYGPNYPDHWDSFKREFSGIDPDLLCRTVEEHNDWVRYVYERFKQWAKIPFEPHGDVNAEQLTPEDARDFWHGLEIIELEPELWNREYCRARMESLYSVMRGSEIEGEGVSFDAKPLSQQQADAVINIFSEYLDHHDLRLSVVQSPGRGFNGQDRLASSYDGGYNWCSGDNGTGCFKAIDPDSVGECRRRACPLLKEREQ